MGDMEKLLGPIIAIPGIVIAAIIAIFVLIELQHVLEIASWLLGFGIIGAIFCLGLLYYFTKNH